MAQIIFDAGRRKAVAEQAQAAYDATVATYRQTVLTAFQSVEDNLAALRILEEEAQQQDKAVKTAEMALIIAFNRYRGGVTTYLEVVTAQNAALVAERTAVDLLTRRMIAAVLLIRAWEGLVGQLASFFSEGQALIICSTHAGAIVIAHVRISEEPQREVRLGRAAAALAIGDDFFVWRDACFGVKLLQLRGKLHLRRIPGGHIVCPVDILCAGDSTAAFAPYVFPRILVGSADVTEGDSTLAQARLHVGGIGSFTGVSLGGEFGGFQLGRLLCDRTIFSRPLWKAAIQDSDGRVCVVNIQKTRPAARVRPSS